MICTSCHTLHFHPDRFHATTITTCHPTCRSQNNSILSTSIPIIPQPLVLSRRTILATSATLFPLLIPSSEALELAFTTTRSCSAPTAIQLFHTILTDSYYLVSELTQSLERCEGVIIHAKLQSEQLTKEREAAEKASSSRRKSRSSSSSSSSSKKSSSTPRSTKLNVDDQASFLRALQRGDVRTTLTDLKKTGYLNAEAFVLRRHGTGMGGVATMRDDDIVTNVHKSCVAYREGLLEEKGNTQKRKK